MNIAKLDRKIVIQDYTDSKNAYGESVRTWDTFHTTFAHVQRDGGMDREEGGKTTATQKVKFKIRFFDGINETMRIYYDGFYYVITQIQELGREGLWIYANKKE